LHDDRRLEGIHRMTPAAQLELWLELARLGMALW
jgi:hypothetical protein